MEQSLRISSKSRLRNNRNQNKKEKEISIQKALYINGYDILLHFSNGTQKIINFLLLFSEYAKGDFEKYLKPSLFKKYIVDNGNIYWGSDEDIIFPASLLFNYPNSRLIKEEVLFVL